MTIKRFIAALVLGALLAACSTVDTPDSEGGSFAGEPQTYLLNGVEYSPAEIESLAQAQVLFYVATPEAAEQGLVHVFDNQAEYDSFKQQYQPSKGLTTQLFNKNTTVYDGTNYNQDKLKLSKGTIVNDLHALIQPDGESWGNQISSLKAADGVWTDLYDFKNLNAGNSGQWRWATFGDNYKNLPSWVNNDTSSIEVGQ